MEPIVNRVAESDLLVFNLEDLWDGKDVRELDIAPMLVEGLILREKAFRDAVKELDVEAFRSAHVAVFCSTDAIVPTWAYMLIATRLDCIAASVGFGSPQDVVRDRFVSRLQSHDWSAYEGRNVVIKGCGSKVVPFAAYVEATSRLQQVADKLMYGEPCSSVPLWRRKNAGKEPAKGARPVASGKLPPGF